MPKIFQALVWASAIIVVALLAVAGTIDKGSATTLMIVLPLLAAMQLGRKNSCCSIGWARGQ